MNFTLRSWALTDLASLVNYANNINIAKYMNDQFPHPYTTEHGLAFIKLATSDTPQTLFAVDVNGKGVGGIGLHPQTHIYRKNAELGYWLAEPYWGHGIITKAVAQMINYGFATFDIDRIFARPFGTNIASQKVLKKAGFTLEATIEKSFYKNGEFFDELIFAIRRKTILHHP